MKKRTNVGGQAVIEGVMMKNANKLAVAVRKQDGEIEVQKKQTDSILSKYKIDKIPFLRGGLVLIETMIEGVKALNFSAQFFEEEEVEKTSFDLFIERVFKDKANDVLVYISMAIALCFSVGIFILLPTFIGGLLKSNIQNIFMLNFAEGMMRILLFVIYVKLISLNGDIKRVFQYHGAEHKTIYCYEEGLELNVENAKKFTTLHPRCGTNFVFIVLFISMIMFSFFGWPNPLMRVVYRLLTLPVVAGIAYEIIKISGKCTDNPIVKIIIFPGLMLQKITTMEPDDSQLEVAIESLKAVIEHEGED